MGAEAFPEKRYPRGEGVTIGVLSDAYNTLGGEAAGIASGDLPDDVEVLSELAAGTGIDEGRGMIELIYDVAPGADIKFYSAFNGYFDFADGIRAADAGCDIIVDDIFYFAEPYFQNGDIAQAVNEVAEQGVLCFSSAGNSAAESYEVGGSFIQIDPTDASYIPGVYEETFADGGSDDLLAVTLQPGQSTRQWWRWDEGDAFYASGSTGPVEDFDILVWGIEAKTVFFGSVADANIGASSLEAFGFGNPGAAPLTFHSRSYVTHLFLQTKIAPSVLRYWILQAMQSTLMSITTGLVPR